MSGIWLRLTFILPIGSSSSQVPLPGVTTISGACYDASSDACLCMYALVDQLLLVCHTATPSLSLSLLPSGMQITRWTPVANCLLEPAEWSWPTQWPIISPTLLNPPTPTIAPHPSFGFAKVLG
ncbi:unnamed protein product [Protopolystoma xenopodis]|uniref:Uncharacterized protein n=1 Tax=Protopolystoma xenopodis TaxID=117903 RepID=A0A448WQU5_9PLAT|nr:unnamed protein product [Protopolystoma xenopodis]